MIAPNTLTLEPSGRNQGIDVLRGLSILFVVMHHVGLRIPLKETLLASFVPKPLLSALIYNGYEAVFVFFVISGFLITTNALKRWGALRRIDVKAFYVRRCARILPCLVLLVMVLAALDLAGAADYVIARAGQSLPRAMVAAFGLHLNWYEGRTGYLPGAWDVLWSLSIEELFYLGFPLVCLSVRSEKLLVGLLLLFVLSLPVSLAAITDNEIWKEKAYLPGMAAIAAGVLGALIAARFRPRRWVVSALGCVGVLGLAAITFAMRLLWPLLHDGVMLWLVIAAACLVVALHWREAASPSRAIAGIGWLCSMGRLSYEIYLTHMFVVFAVVALRQHIGGDPAYGFLWYLPAVALSWLLGALVARLYSVPSDRALRGRMLKAPMRVREQGTPEWDSILR